MIKDVLPVGSDGVDVVFENKCNPSFTNQIQGPNDVYISHGDLHDDMYDKDEISSWLSICIPTLPIKVTMQAYR